MNLILPGVTKPVAADNPDMQTRWQSDDMLHFKNENEIADILLHRP